MSFSWPYCLTLYVLDADEVLNILMIASAQHADLNEPGQQERDVQIDRVVRKLGSAFEPTFRSSPMLSIALAETSPA